MLLRHLKTGGLKKSPPSWIVLMAFLDSKRENNYSDAPCLLGGPGLVGPNCLRRVSPYISAYCIAMDVSMVPGIG